MKFLGFFLLFLPAIGISQTAIPIGTILPVGLKTSIHSQKTKAGDVIEARIMQDVPLEAGEKIPIRSKVIGHVIGIENGKNGDGVAIRIRFDALELKKQRVAISTNLRAIASLMEVADAQVPSSGPDRGTPAAWTTRNLVGGEVAYGDGGPVARGTHEVGKALADGVLARVQSNDRGGCRGDAGDNDREQALWVFSSDACGLYGFSGARIAHAGRTLPKGEIVIVSQSRTLDLQAGIGMLLRVNGGE